MYPYTKVPEEAMTHHTQVSDWTEVVSRNLPQLSKPQATVLAWWSFGIVMTHSCSRTLIASFLALLLGRNAASVAQRLREWCYPAEQKRGRQRQELDASTCFAPLLAWVLRLWSGSTLALALDATTLSNHFVVLSISVVYRGCAIPVAWTVLAQTHKGSWRPHWQRMLRLLRRGVPAEMSVLVLADRGLYAGWLFRRIVRLGWHPFLRVNVHTTFRPTGSHRWYRLSELTPTVGSQWSGSGWAFKTNSSRLSCTVACWWAEGCSVAWCVLTDLVPSRCDVAWYGLRSWCEQGFKCVKRGAWQWHKTRMRDPERAERMWLAVAVATLWMLSVGSDVEDELHTANAPELGSLLPLSRANQQRHVRVLRLGLLWLMVQLLDGRSLPLPRQLLPEPWPSLPLDLTRPFLLEHPSPLL
jgi:hypothetical protein